MTLYEFNEHDLNERAKIVWSNGVNLADRNEGDYDLILYKIGDFYAEVYYNKKTDQIDAIKSFKSDDPLQPYLNNLELQEMLKPDVIRFQTALYHAKKINDEIGWDYDEIIFESKIYSSPTDAMDELNNSKHPNTPWFETMRLYKNGKIIEEDLFHSSIINIE